MARVLVASRVDPETRRRLQALADKQDRTIAWLVRQAIEQLLAKPGKAVAGGQERKEAHQNP